ncbi:MAG: T9SS type A sorting domain-containing protein [Bacteroidetes bacterium]|nr:MAG: T9SS type A sorting domain-containing protein [Bacteroidota bacterium]
MKSKVAIIFFIVFLFITSQKLHSQVFTDVYSSTNIPLGGIIEIFDYDNDGLEDWVYEIYGDSTFHLLKNQGNGNFTDVTVSSNFPRINPSQYFANTNDPTPVPVDIDNDGDYDIFYWETFGGDLHLHLWENRSGVFQEVSACIGWANSLLTGNLYADGMRAFSFVDYDKDGDLDITYNTVFDNATPQSTLILRNDINSNGLFAYSDTLITGFPIGLATRLYPFDFDNDGDFDFIGWEITPGQFATFNFHTIKLYRNDDSLFTDISALSGLAAANYSGGMTYFDYNNDGFLDVLFGCTDNNFNSPPDNKFFQNNGDGTFTDITSINNVHYSNHYNGPTGIDYNNDGYEDLCFDMSGFGMNHAPFYTNYSSVFVENADTLGINVILPGGQNSTGGRRWIDYNNDGLLDLFVGQGVVDYLFQNNLPNSNSKYLNITLQGCISPTDPSGARVVVFANGHKQTRYFISERVSTSRVSSKILHFGLSASSVADSINVFWPSGIITRLYNVASDQDLLIHEDSNCTRQPSLIASSIYTLNRSICQGDSLYAGGGYQTQPGTYYDYYPISGGCDSLVITNLSFSLVLPSPQTIYGPDTVCAGQQNVTFSILPVLGASSYQWSIPVGSTLNSGGGTTSINITLGNSPGYIVVSAVNSCSMSLPTHFYVYTTICTGIEDLQELTSLSVYPNPVNDKLHIQYELNSAKDISIFLKDIFGRDVLDPIHKINITGLQTDQFSTNSVSMGMYILQIKSGDQSVNHRIIINH